MVLQLYVREKEIYTNCSNFCKHGFHDGFVMLQGRKPRASLSKIRCVSGRYKRVVFSIDDDSSAGVASSGLGEFDAKVARFAL